jgi:hypothetical protein
MIDDPETLADPEEEEQEETVLSPEEQEQPSANVNVNDENERLRQPRAQTFRRRIRNQVSMLPLALSLLALGGYLIAREREVEGLPDISTWALVGGFILALAFTAVFHSLIFDRRERGLLFFGLLVLSGAGTADAVIYGIDKSPDLAEWWPISFVTISVALFLTYLIERMHDARLVLLSVMILVAGGTAFVTTNGNFDEARLHDAAEYWPLLLSVIGIGLLPLAFRRRTG